MSEKDQFVSVRNSEIENVSSRRRGWQGCTHLQASSNKEGCGHMVFPIVVKQNLK